MPLENSVIFRITKLINLNKSIINILIIIFNFFLTNNPIFINIIHKYFKLFKKILGIFNLLLILNKSKTNLKCKVNYINYLHNFFTI